MTWLEFVGEISFVAIVVVSFLYHQRRLRRMQQDLRVLALRSAHNRQSIVGIMQHHGIQAGVEATLEKTDPAKGNGGTPPKGTRRRRGKRGP